MVLSVRAARVNWGFAFWAFLIALFTGVGACDTVGRSSSCSRFLARKLAQLTARRSREFRRSTRYRAGRNTRWPPLEFLPLAQRFGRCRLHSGRSSRPSGCGACTVGVVVLAISQATEHRDDIEPRLPSKSGSGSGTVHGYRFASRSAFAVTTIDEADMAAAGDQAA